MKKYTKYIVVLVILLSMGTFSCTDMTEDTTGKMTAANFYSDPALISKAVGAAYSELQGYQNHWGVWGLQTVSSDECVVPTRAPGNDWYDGGVWQAFHKHDWQVNLDKLNGVWTSIYSGITTCNRIILDLDTYKGTMTQTIYDRYKAETIILRDFYYTLLIDLFGNVPYVDDYKGSVVSYNQSTRAELFTKISESILANVQYLDDVPTASNYGRCTKSMAYTMLAKLYLNAKVFKGASQYTSSDMDKVIEYCNMVINTNYYTISADFKEPFKVKNESCKENIFVIPMQNGVSTKGGDYEFHFHKFSGHSLCRAVWGLSVGCWNGGCACPSFMNLYDDTDTRKKATWLYGLCTTPEGAPVMNTDLPDQQLNLTIEVSSLSAAKKWEGARMQKYEYEKGMTGNMNNDFVIYRLADVYCMKAEAILRGGTKSNLIDLCSDASFKKIRQRASMPVYTESTLTLDELINERGREFAWEGWRRQDLIRWDKFSKGSWSFKDPKADNTRDLFPIPYDQITKNPTWKQNPGY
ncbi:MAG: RagB/SusD family nutrient uptake outer membrane protein [Prolixibacteraceae bacterium]|nr:RagB/SusD family nutrient uptake outer membrane protein [Prolixibacteraceae bacterium]